MVKQGLKYNLILDDTKIAMFYERWLKQVVIGGSKADVFSMMKVLDKCFPEIYEARDFQKQSRRTGRIRIIFDFSKEDFFECVEKMKKMDFVELQQTTTVMKIMR